MIRCLLTLTLIVASICSFGQSIPVEGLVGTKNYWYQHSVSRKFSPSGRIGFSHVSSMYNYYEANVADEIMSQSYITYEITKGIGVAAGTFYATGPGFSPSLALQLSRMSKDVFLMFVPRVDVRKDGSYEGMVLIEYRPALTRGLHLYSRFQAMSNFSGDTHNRSYQSFRAGVQVKKMQFGVALSVDEYGAEKETRRNLGFFVRTEL